MVSMIPRLLQAPVKKIADVYLKIVFGDELPSHVTINHFITIRIKADTDRTALFESI